VPIGANIQMAHIASGAGTATAAAPLTGGAIRAGSTISGLTFTNSSVTIPAVGRYAVSAAISSAAITTSPTVSASTNTIGVGILAGNGASGLVGFILNSQGATVNVFDVTAPNGVLTLNAGTGVLAGNYDLLISQLSSGLTVKPPTEDRLDVIERWLAQNPNWLNPTGVTDADLKLSDRKDQKQDLRGMVMKVTEPYHAVNQPWTGVDSDGETVVVAVASSKTAAAGSARSSSKGPASK